LTRREALAPVKRWTAYRKLGLLTAIRNGVVGREDAMASHGISGEELRSWERGFDMRGAEALKARAPLRRLRATGAEWGA
jgi:hypothetical protein